MTRNTQVTPNIYKLLQHAHYHGPCTMQKPGTSVTASVRSTQYRAWSYVSSWSPIRVAVGQPGLRLGSRTFRKLQIVLSNKVVQSNYQRGGKSCTSHALSYW